MAKTPNDQNSLQTAQTKILDVNRIYDEPNLSGVAMGEIGWSPDGATMSYVRSAGKNNELWGYDVADGTGRLLFDFARLRQYGNTEDEADPARHPRKAMRDWRTRRVQSAGNFAYQWTPDGKKLLLSASGATPAFLDLQTDQLVSVTQNPAPIRDCRISPNGSFLTFVRGWDLYMIDLATSVEYPLTSGSTEALRSATPDTMGDLLVDSGHWWSPDSSQVAFLQTDEKEVPLFWVSNLMSGHGQNTPERFPQPGDPIPAMGLKVVSASGYRWMDTSAWRGWYLARVKWLPDSRHLLLQMLNREQTELCLVLADSRTGATQTILTETDPCWVNVVDDLHFFADGRRFLWSSERDSYRQLYLYDIDGTQLLQLTSEAEASVAVEALDEKGCAVYYLVWPDPYTEAHLKRVTWREHEGQYQAGEAILLTAAGTSHFTHLCPNFKYYGDHNSTAIRPPRLDLYLINGEKVASVEDNPCTELASYGLRQFEYLSIPAAPLGIPSDDMPLHAKLLEPANRKAGEKYPVIVYIYGGPLPGGFGLARNVLNYWRPVPELWLQMMAQNGYGVFSLDNRGSNAAPRGHDWETPIHRRLGHVELQDQLEGVKYLKSLDWVDPKHIGILGGSFGGFMTLNAMLRAADTFRSGLCYAPVTNWREYDCVYTERYMDLPVQNAEGYKETALPQYAENLLDEQKLLMLHGGNDPNVHLQHSIQLIDELVIQNKRFRMMLYPNQVHMSFFGMGQSPARTWGRIKAYFDQTLGDK